MREVDLYTLKKEKVLVTSDYISVAQYSDKPIHVRGSDEFIVNAPVEVMNIPVEYYQIRKDVGKPYETVSAHLVAFDPKIRELLGINEKQLKDDLSQLKKLYDSSLKTNESLVEYKNDLLQENCKLINKNSALFSSNSLLLSDLSIYTDMSFWKRLVFLFTGKVN